MYKIVSTLVLVCILGACASTEEKPHPFEEYLATLPKIQAKVNWHDNVAEYGIDRFARLVPMVHGGSVFTADHKGVVKKLALQSGKVEWQSSFNIKFSAGPEVIDGQILLGSLGAEVVSIDASNGKINWRSKVSSEVITPPKRVADIIIAQSIDGRVSGLDATNGKVVWTFSRQVPILTLRGNSPPLIVDDMVIVGLSSGKLIALAAADGKMLWENSVAVPRGRSELERVVDIDGAILHDNGTLYVVSYQGRVAAVTIESGRILWTREMSSYVGLSMSEQNLFITDADGKLWALDKGNGATLWMQDKLQNLINTTATVDGDKLTIGDVDGNIYILKQSDGSVVGKYPYDSLARAIGIISDADTEEELKKYERSRGLYDFGLVAAPTKIENDFLVTYRSGVVAKISIVK